MPFFLILDGGDKWVIANYTLLGFFKESWFPPNAIDSNVVHDHGWLLMTAHDGPIGLSNDPDEATRSFYPITIDAAFPPEAEPRPWPFGRMELMPQRSAFEHIHPQAKSTRTGSRAEHAKATRKPPGVESTAS
jgi:hypothetical protein